MENVISEVILLVSGRRAGSCSRSRCSNESFFVSQIPKFILNQVRKHNMENQRKMNRDRAVKKLLKKMAYDRERASDKQEKNTEVREQITQSITLN